MGYDIGNICSPITLSCLTFPKEKAADFLKESYYTYSVFCSPVVYPVVPKVTIILQLITTALHQEGDISQTFDAFDKLQQTFALNSVPEQSEG